MKSGQLGKLCNEYMTTNYYTIAENENHQVNETTSAIKSDSITKDEVLEMLSGPHMSGCYTAVRSADVQGNNENYGSTPVDSFFDEEGIDYLPDDNWTLTSFCIATSDYVDIEVWAQEFNENDKSAFEKSMKDGSLYVASFWHDVNGVIDILIWKS